MSREKLSKRYVRKLGKIGSASNHSYYVTLPIEYVRSMGWRDNQKLVVRKRGTKLVIEDWAE